jgi:hypothetical protein
MPGKSLLAVAAAAAVTAAAAVVVARQEVKEYKSGVVWPEPPVVTPGAKPGDPPSDAIILFDGKDLSKWKGGERWEVKDGYAVVRGGDITTRDNFGDYQLHVEFATPEKVRGSGQGRGNSGVFLADRYEVQVLDSFDNRTYFDGQAGSLYKQQPPMVNASRRPGEWQTFDIVFEAPRFDGAKLVRPGIVTVFHNGVLAQNHFELQGGTYYDRPASYEPHPVRQPIRLQDHGDPVRYRNIWLRELNPIVGMKPAGK